MRLGIKLLYTFISRQQFDTVHIRCRFGDAIIRAQS